MTDQMGSTYVGAEVDANLIVPYVDSLSLLVGRKRVSELQERKAQRDGPCEHHLTLVSPPEFHGCNSTGLTASLEVTLVGIGRQANDVTETYYVVVESTQAQDFRRRLGLPPRDLHITLGYDPSDIYDMPKGLNTLVSRSNGDVVEFRFNV